jgi:hypothetical protein
VYLLLNRLMPHFTNVELTDMVLAYGAGGGNAVQVQILYPDMVVLNSKTFTSTVQRQRDTGKFRPRTEDRGRDHSQILEAVEANPVTSTRRLAF